jgi:poly(hydroxyalkanoate) depolymerase family esterase
MLAKSRFDLPRFDLPKFDLPRLDLSRFSKLRGFAPPEMTLPGLTLPAGGGVLPEATGLPSGLGDMLARLGGLKPGAPLCGTAAGAAPEVAVPAGASFADLTHRGPAGSLDYRLYVPAGAAGRVLPLVVMLHGCTQSPEDFAAGTRMNEVAEAEGLLVAYPRQTRAANAQKCWNWFDPKDQGRDRGEPALIAGMVRDILRDREADASRVYVAGLSAGGAAAAILAQAYPELFAAAGVHSGLAAGAASDMPGAFAAMRGGGRAVPGRAVPTIVFHGSGDHTVAPANGDAVAAQARGGSDLAETVSRGRVEGGLAFTRTVGTDPAGLPQVERWLVDGAGHAWSGGSAAGSYTEPRGPDASREMLRFFLRHRLVAEA